MYYHFKIHKDKDGLWAECIELKGCITQASKNTMNDLFINMEEALNLYLDEPADSKVLFPLPKKNLKGINIVKVNVNPRIAFALQLRELRIKNNLTQKQVSEKLGFKNIWNYQRLEASKTANPELETLIKIKKTFPEFDINLVL